VKKKLPQFIVCVIALFTLAVPLANAQALRLEIAVSDDLVEPGEQFTFVAALTNSELVNSLDGVQLELLVPNGIESFSIAAINGLFDSAICLFPNGSATANCGPSATLRIQLGTLQAGESRTLQVPLVVLDSLPLNSVVDLAFEADYTNNTANVVRTETVRVNNPALADLDLDISADRDPLAPNSELTYTLSYGNRGISSASAVMLVVPLPVGVTFVSASDGGSLMNNEVTWSIGNLAAGSSGRRMLTVQETSGQAGHILLASAEISDSTGVGPDDRASLTTVVADDQALDVSVSVEADPSAPGEQFFFEVTLSNRDVLNELEDVRMELRLPQGIEGFTTASLNGLFSSALCIFPGGAATANCGPSARFQVVIGILQPGESRTIRGPLVISDATNPGEVLPLRFESRYSGAQSSLIRSEVMQVAIMTSLELDIGSNRNPLPLGGELTYTLTYGNRGVSSANGVELIALLPEGLEFVAASQGGTQSNNEVRWSVGTLAPGMSQRRELTLRDNNGQAGDIVQLQAELMDTDGSEPDARAAMSVVLADDSLLALTVNIESDPTAPGEQFFFTANLSNQSNTMQLPNTQLELRLPQGIDGFTVSSLTGLFDNALCIFPNGAATANCGPSARLRLLLGDLEVGESRVIRGPLVVSDETSPGAVLPFRFESRYTGSPAPDIKSEVMQVAIATSLDLEISTDQNPVQAGAQFAYKLGFGNRGISVVNDLELVLQLPNGVDLISASDGGTQNGNEISWAIGSLPAGHSEQREVIVSENMGLSGELLVAEARLFDAMGTEPDARGSSSTVVASPSPLSASVGLQTDPSIPGEQFFYAATVSNVSTTLQLSGVQLELRLPEGIEGFTVAALNGPFESALCIFPNGSASASCGPNARLRVIFGELEAGESRTIRAPLIVSDATALGRVLALRFESRYDAGLGPVFRSELMQVNAVTDLGLDISTSQDPLTPGDELTYTLTYGNRGISTLGGVNLSVLLPDGVEFISASNGGRLLGRSVNWPIGLLLEGTGDRRQLTVRDTTGQTGNILMAEAALLDANGADTRGSTLTTLRTEALLDMSFGLDQSFVLPGDEYHYTVTMSNTNSVARLDNVQLEIRLPEGVDNFITSDITGVFNNALCIYPDGSASANCGPNARLRLRFGDLDAGESRTISGPLNVLLDEARGTVSHVRAEARYEFQSVIRQLTRSQSIVVGTQTPVIELVFSDGFESQ